MTAEWQDVIARHRRIQAYQHLVLALVVCWGLLATFGWMRAMSQFRISVPPQLQYGAQLRVGEKGAWEIYTFAGYIWQQLGTWPEDGARDAEHNLVRLRPFLTERSLTTLRALNRHRHARDELRGRQRQIVPHGTYAARLVQWNGDAWQVQIDQIVEERIGTLVLKRQLFRYKLRLVQTEADPERNPWHLVLDLRPQDAEPERLEDYL